jgi:hypothetical protein
VVDFIDADFFNINILGFRLSRWPVFNIADASVTCGVVLMLFSHRKAYLGGAGAAAQTGPLPGETSSTGVLPAGVAAPDPSQSSGSGTSPQS